jgi:predicted dienelactone hydrolase
VSSDCELGRVIIQSIRVKDTFVAIETVTVLIMGNFTSVLLSIGTPLLFILLIPVVYRYIENKKAKKRKEVTRFVYEEELLASGKVRHEEEYVQFKNRTLYRQTWSPVFGELKGILLMAHGMNSYSGKLAKIVLPFCEAGYVVIAFDHYGHGRSDGIHGYYPSVEYLSEDLHFHINSVKKTKPEYANLPIFKFGMSLGGLVCLTHSVKCKL